MNRVASTIGLLGASLGVAGLIAYSIAPEKLWLVTLCEGIALICLIIFFVLHFESLKAFSSRRSTRMGLNSILIVLLFIGILGIVNFLAAWHAHQWDISETQRFTLSPQTARILQGLNKDVKIMVFSQERNSSFRDLLDLYKAQSDRISLEFVDSERNPRLARQYGVTRPDTVIFESGPLTSRVTTASESELTGALIKVSRDTGKRILFLDGHGERSLLDAEGGGLTSMKAALEKQGYTTAAFTLLKEPDIPRDTTVLVIAGPRRPVTKEEQTKIARYVKNGGRALIMVDPSTQSHLEELVGLWGVRIGPGVIVDPQDHPADADLTSLLVTTFTAHDITRDLKIPALLPFTRHLDFQETSDTAWEITPLARTSTRSWAQADIDARVYTNNKQRDPQGPFWIAAAIEPQKAPPEGQPKAAIVIVGNSSFASNAYMKLLGNPDLLLSAIGWLADERDLISITPKEKGFRPFVPDQMQERILFVLQTLLLPTVITIWGFITWRRRRRL